VLYVEVEENAPDAVLNTREGEFDEDRVRRGEGEETAERLEVPVAEPATATSLTFVPNCASAGETANVSGKRISLENNEVVEIAAPSRTDVAMKVARSTAKSEISKAHAAVPVVCRNAAPHEAPGVSDALRASTKGAAAPACNATRNPDVVEVKTLEVGCVDTKNKEINNK